MGRGVNEKVLWSGKIKEENARKIGKWLNTDIKCCSSCMITSGEVEKE